MNTKKLFGFDANKCLKHCTSTTCDRLSFRLPQFCPNATDDCIKEQELCGCWHLVRMRAIGLFAAGIRDSALLVFAFEIQGENVSDTRTGLAKILVAINLTICTLQAMKVEALPYNQTGAWGRGRCHACEMCTHLNDCPSKCDVKPLRSLATASTTFSKLWAALETHASETLIAFVITHASFEGESKLDLR